MQSPVQAIRGIGIASRMEAVLPRESGRILVAYLTPRDFASARLKIPEVGAFKDYEDWLDFRTSAVFGLEAAGFFVEQITVDISKFTRWSESASIAPSISALDEFVRALLPSAKPEPRDKSRFQAVAQPFSKNRR